MMRGISTLLAVALLGTTSVTQAADKVRLVQGATASGTIKSMGPTVVTLTSGALDKEFPVNEIEWISFDDEPSELALVRTAIAGERYEEAVRQLARIDASKVERPEIKQDLEFYQALTAARLALAGNGSVPDAGRQMLACERSGVKNYHYLTTCEVLGDLLVAIGKYDQARTFYKHVAEAPWPEAKLKAAVLDGRALLAAKQFDQALAKFDEALSHDAKGKQADSDRLEAALGKAGALVGLDKTEDAITLIEGVISQADPEDQGLHARAYNVLGDCYVATDRKPEAIRAFLHVDLLYASQPSEHAQALANLVKLWTEDDKPDRAAEARNQLKERYPHSRWARP